MERPAILNRSMPSTAGATISIPPARAVDEAFLREVPAAVKNAMYNRYREYTRWRALFPDTFVPVLTRRADCSLVALITSNSQHDKQELVSEKPDCSNERLRGRAITRLRVLSPGTSSVCCQAC